MKKRRVFVFFHNDVIFYYGEDRLKYNYNWKIPVKIDEESIKHHIFVNILLENPVRIFIQLGSRLLESMLFAYEFSAVLGMFKYGWKLSTESTNL